MKTIALIAMGCMLYAHAIGQETNMYFNFRPSSSPAINILSKAGEIKVDMSRQLYLGDPDFAGREYYDSSSFGHKAIILFGRNYALVADSRLGLSYTPTDNLTLGVAFLISHKFHDFYMEDYTPTSVFEEKLYLVQFSLDTRSWEVFGSYHSDLNRFFSYELRSAISLGSGKHIYKRTHKIFDIYHPFPDKYFDDHLKYKTFRYSVGLAGAFHYGPLNCVLQVNAGAIRHFELSAYIMAPAVFHQMVSQISHNKTDFFADPSFLLGLDFAHWGVNLSCGFPWSVNDSKFIELKPTFGIGLNFKLNYLPSKKE